MLSCLAVGTVSGVLAGAVVDTVDGDEFVGLGSREGLAHDSVYEVLESRHGFLWIATEDGLSRYDGYAFKSYRHDPDDATSLAENDINSLAEGRDGKLWIGTWGAGMDAFDPEREVFEHYRNDPDDPHSLLGFRVQAVLAATDGTIWAGTYRFGLNRFDPETGRFSHFRHDPERPESLPHDHVWSLAQAPDGRIWIGTNAGLAASRAGGRFEVFRHDPGNPASLSHDRARAVRFDRSGRLWICTERGLDSLDPQSGRVERHLTNEGSPAGQDLRTFKDLVEGPDGILWIATRNRGLLEWDRSAAGAPTAGLKIHAYHSQDPHSLTNNDVRALWIDSAANLWAGTRGGGLNRLDLKPRKFRTYAAKDDGGPLSHNRVLTIQEQSRDTVWVGTSQGLDRLRLDATGAAVAEPLSAPAGPTLPPGSVRALHLDAEERLWIGTDRGLARLDTRSGDLKLYVNDPSDPLSLAHDEILTLYEDSSGNLWIGTDGGGLDRLDRWSGHFSHLRHDPKDAQSLSFDRVRVVLEDPDGTLWVGTDGGGLNRLDPARGSFHSFRSTDEPHSLSNDNVVSLLRSQNRDLWIGTHSGLNRLRSDNESFDTIGDLPATFIYGIAESDGRLWMTTNQGIVSFDPQTGASVQHGLDDGLRSLSFNEGALHRGAGGRIYAGGIRGLAVFEPANLQANSHRPPVYFTRIESLTVPLELERPAWRTDSLTLDATSTILSLEVAALDFTAPERNRYQYKISPRHDTWQDMESRRLTLVDLPPGAVEVRVRGSNNDDVWSAEDAVLHLQLEAPFWYHTRNKILLGLGALLMLGALHLLGVGRYLDRIRALENRLDRARREASRRRRLLEQVRRESRRFAFLLSHDFKSPMVNLQGFAGELERAIEDVRHGLGEHADDADSAAGIALNQTIPESLSFVAGSVRRLQRMTESIQRLTQLADHQVHHESVELVPTLKRAFERAATAIPGQGAHFELGELPAPPKIETDPDLLESILFELLVNALEYSSPDRRSRIDVDGAFQGDMLRLSIRDNGRGVAPQHGSRIFDALYRAHAAPDPSRGMGLAWAQGAANLLDGWIDIESTVGVGTVMSLWLPRLAPRQETRGIDGP